MAGKQDTTTKSSEAEKYKKEAEQYKKKLVQAIDKAQPHAEHMRARHIEGLHAFYKEKLGYTGTADIESMKTFKHNYFEQKENQEEAVNYFADFHVHKAILTFYDELFKQKSEKPLHKLDGKEYNKRVANAMQKAKELRKENPLRYKLLFQDYAGLEKEVLEAVIKKHKHQFIDVYTQKILPEIITQYAHTRANIDAHELLKDIKPEHIHHDEELESLVKTLFNKHQPYMAAPYDEEINPEHYQLPQRDLLPSSSAMPKPEPTKIASGPSPLGPA